MKVVDASAIVDALIGDDRGRRVASHLDDDLYAPCLMQIEVLQVIRRFVASSKIRPDVADAIIELFLEAPIEYLSSAAYGQQVWEWRHSLRPYDATYVALALDVGAPLLTTDLRLARAAEQHVPVIAI